MVSKAQLLRAELLVVQHCEIAIGVKSNQSQSEFLHEPSCSLKELASMFVVEVKLLSAHQGRVRNR